MADELMGSDAYEVLGVPGDASPEELRRAYRRRMRQTHPDLGGDPDVFAVVQRAWLLVGTPTARSGYDRSRRTGRSGVEEPQSGRVWTAGSSARSTPRARTYGHPGGWSRQRYLELIREWVGRGARLEDPYASELLERAPWQIQHVLADAVAEEETARSLSSLSSAFTVWHDVDTRAGKLDHIVLGPSGLFAAQSEDWLAPVAVGTRDLVIEGSRERPLKDLLRRARAVSPVGVRFGGFLVVVPDEHLSSERERVGRARPVRIAVRHSSLTSLLTGGVPGVPPIDTEVLFDWRTRLQRGLTLL